MRCGEARAAAARRPVPRRVGGAAAPGDRPGLSAPSGRSSIITASISPVSPRRPGAREAGHVLLVGRLVEKKGTQALLEASPSPAVPAARLAVIIGDGPLRSRLERQAGASWSRRRSASSAAAAAGQVGALDAARDRARRAERHRARRRSRGAAERGRRGRRRGRCPSVGSDHSGMPEAVVEGASGFVVPEAMPKRSRRGSPAARRCRSCAAGWAPRRGRWRSGGSIARARMRLLEETLRRGRGRGRDAPDLSLDVGAAGPQGGPRAGGQHRRRLRPQGRRRSPC